MRTPSLRVGKLFLCLFGTFATVLLSACSGGASNSGSSGTSNPPAPATYTVSANVTGLTGTGLVLQLNGSYTTPVPANGTINFPFPITSGTAYNVTVSTPPTGPDERCSVSNGTGTVTGNVTNISVACAFDLTTAPSRTAVDPSVPLAAAALVSSVVTAADVQPLGAPVLIPQSSASLPTPLFVEDSGGNVLLAALSNSASTTFSVDSTAITLVSLTMGVTGVQGDLRSNTFQTAVRSTSSFSSLTSDITAALTAGTAPLDSPQVITDIVGVVAQVVQGNNGALVAAAHLRLPLKAHDSAGTPQLPYQLAGPFTQYPTLESVYLEGLSQVGGADGIDVVNSMNIEFNVSTADAASGQTLQSNTILTGSSFLLSQISTATPVHLQTEEGTYRLTLNQNDETKYDNRLLLASDIISSVLAVAGFQDKIWGSCAKKQVGAFLSNLGDTAQQAFLTAPTGTAALATLSGAMTANVYLQLAESTYNCAAKDTLSTALQQLSRFVLPIKKIWDITSGVWTITQSVTDAAQVAVYWNRTITHQFCEKGGALTNCGARHDLLFLPFDYLLIGDQATTNHLTFSVNGVQVASYSIINASGAPNSFKICNVPGGTFFNLDYATQNVTPGPDTGEWGLYAENALVQGLFTFGYYTQQAYLPLPSGSAPIQADSCADTASCISTPAFTSTVNNACVVIPGVND